MNQRIVPISLTKIQFSKIYSFYGRGGKMLKPVFSWNLLPDQMKASFSRAAFNCVEKNVNLRQCNDFHSKNVLLRLAATARKKTWNEAEEFDASFDCYFTQASPLGCFHT